MKILNDYEDFLNKKRTRNENNICTSDFNCGGYALRTFNWYEPSSFEDNDYYTGAFTDDESLIYIALEDCVKSIIEDFEGTVREVYKGDKIEEDEELVAFRLSYDELGDGIELGDFHFVVFREGQWMEKNGISSIKPFNFTEDDWITNAWIYNSPIAYLAHKI